MSSDRYYTIRVDRRGWPDPEEGPDGPMTREEALARQTGPDAHSMWRTIALQVADAAPGVVAEYGTQRKSGDRVVWDTAPYVEKVYPLAKRIKDGDLDGGGKVYRRRIIVVEDWEEVDAP